MFGRRAAFWGAVAGVAILAPFGLQLLAAKVPVPGLQRFAQFTARGGNC